MNNDQEAGGYPRFQIDKPSAVDELGAHDRLADAIVHVLQDVPDVKTIGVLGSWGSGKSTVIELVERKLHECAETQHIHCFKFDAWLHQSDPPRRAFLDGLVAYLKNQEGFDDLNREGADWHPKFDELNKVTDEFTSTTTPRLTKAGTWYLPTLVMLPLGLKLIGDGSLAAEDQSDFAAIFAFILGWLLSTGPALVALAIYFAWRPHRKFWTKEFWSKHIKEKGFWISHRGKAAGESIIAVIANKAVEVKHELRTKSLEPSTIEFQDAFREIVSKAQQSSRKLVIVVDNLDRISVSEAMAFWATIRSFFLGADGGVKQINRSELPTVLLPIDEGAISKIYEDSRDRDLLSRSFIEKTFDLVMYVPAPVLSRWHDYLNKKISATFGHLASAGDVHQIGLAYEDWLRTSDQKPTPRSITSFVNSMAVVVVQFGRERLPFGVVAQFVLQRAKYEKLHAALKAPNPLLDSFDPDWRGAIAALHYGVSRDDVREIFIDEPLRGSIQSRDKDRFAEIVAVPGFDSYFLTLLKEWPANDEAFSAYDVASVLSSISHRDAPWLVDAWAELRKIAVGRFAQVRYQASDHAALESLIDNCPPVEQNYFIARLKAASETMPSDFVSTDGGEPFVDLAALLIAKSADSHPIQNYSVPGGMEEFVRAILNDHMIPYRRIIRTSGNGREMARFLATRLSEQVPSGPVGELMAAFIDHGVEDFDWETLVAAIGEAFGSGDYGRTISALGAAYVAYPASDVARSRVATWRDQNLLNNAFNVVWGSSVDTALAIAQSLLMATNAVAGPPDGRTWDQKITELPDVPDLVDRALRKMNERRDIKWLSDRFKAAPHEAALIRRLVARELDSGDWLPSAAILLSNAQAIIDLVPVELQPELWSNASLADDLWGLAASLPYPLFTQIFQFVCASGKGQAAASKALKDRLQKATSDELVAAVRGGQEPFDLVRAGQKHVKGPLLGIQALNPLSGLLDELIATNDDSFRRRWFELARQLQTAPRKAVLKGLRDKLTNGAAVQDLRALLSAGGKDTLTEAEFEKQADHSVRHIVLPLLGTADGRAWLVENGTIVHNWFRAADQSSRDTVLEAVQIHVEVGDQQAVALAHQLTSPDERA
jgi:hypothetical protein